MAAILPWTWFVWRSWHGLADLIAIGFPFVVAAGLMLIAVVGRRSRETFALVPAVSLIVLGGVVVVLPMRAAPTGPPSQTTTMLSANLESIWFSDNDFLWHLETNPADVVLVSEMQRSHRERLRERFPFHLDDVIIEEQFRTPPSPDDDSYRRHGFPSIGLYSNYPITELDDATGILDGLPGFRAELALPEGPIVVYGLHVPKPSFRDGLYQVSFSEHREFADRLAAAIAAEELPVVVLGDLNMTDRGGSFHALLDAGLRDGMRSSRVRPTSSKGFWWDLLLLRIDHLLVSDELCTSEARADAVQFTDHLIIRAQVGRCVR